MADNSVINAGSGGDTIRDKDRSGVKTQIVGLDLGIGGTEALAGTVTGPTNITLASAALGVITLGTFSATAPTAGSAVTASVPGCGIAGIGFNNTNFIGTLCFDATTDGTNWFGVSVRPQGQDNDIQSIALTSATHFQAIVGCAGFQQVRIRCSAFTSGAGAASIVPTFASSSPSSSTTGASSIGAINRVGMAHTSAITSVGSATSSTSLLAANVNRIGATVYNDSTATLYVALSTSASTSTYTAQVQAGGYYEVPYGWDGAIFGIWAAVNGNARVTELT